MIASSRQSFLLRAFDYIAHIHTQVTHSSVNHRHRRQRGREGICLLQISGNFSGKYHVKFRHPHFVNFLGKYHVKFGHTIAYTLLNTFTLLTVYYCLVIVIGLYWLI